MSQRLISALVQTFQDPRQANLWIGGGKGLDFLHLAVFANLVPPEALEQPQKYRPQLRFVIDRIRHLEALDYVAPTGEEPIQEGLRPTEAAISHVSQVSKPWWRAALDRFL
ncbi:MAG: hypothetical protein HYY02_06115 [Chloroflexi bacterium]|nr:hypothetical protein [Chloroflexota bacterium]